MATRKVLVAPGYGAGWSTWNSHPEELATDPELVRIVEEGGDWLPAFKKRAQAIVGEGQRVYLSGAEDGLEVKTVEGRFQIDEYDGYETLIEEGVGSRWM